MPSLRKGSSLRQALFGSTSTAVPLPPAIVLDGASVIENVAAGTFIGELSVANVPGDYTFALSNNAGGRAAITGGNHLVVGATNPDYEDGTLTGHKFTVTVTATPVLGGSAALSQSFDITIANVVDGTLNDLTLLVPAVTENTAAGVGLGALQGRTSGSTLSLVDDAGGRFTLNPTTGQIFTGAVSTNYEAATSHDIVVREVLAGGINSPHLSTITITVNNVPEVTLAALSLSASSIVENSAAGVVVGTVLGKLSAAAVELVDDAGGRFAYNPSTGQLLAGLVATNYEAATSHQVTLRETAGDSTNSPRDTTLTVQVTNANEAPSDITVTWRAGFAGGIVPEDTAVGTVLADLARIDPDAGDTGAFSEQADPENKFTVTGTTLVLGAAIDFESDTSHQVTIRFTDAGALYFDKTVTVTVGNVSEGPAKLTKDEIVVLGDNSWGTQAGMNDNNGWGALMSGMKGYYPICWRHARGGDTLKDLIGRWPQIAAMNPKGVFVMSPQNSLGFGTAAALADWENIWTKARDSGVRWLIYADQPHIGNVADSLVNDFNTALNDWAATKAGMTPGVVVSHRSYYADLRADHVQANGGPNYNHTGSKGAYLCGKADRIAYDEIFESTPLVTDFTTPLAGNLNPDWNMADSDDNGYANGWALTDGGYVAGGSTIFKDTGFFRSPGMQTVPCQIFRVSGASTANPASVNLYLRKTIAVSNALAMTGKFFRTVMFIELTNIVDPAITDPTDQWNAAGPPENLATWALATGSGNLFSQGYQSANGACYMDAKFAGIAKTLPGLQSGQNANQSIDVHVRPMPSPAVASIEIRFGYVMLFMDEQVAYGTPVDQMKPLPTTREDGFAANPIWPYPTINATGGLIVGQQATALQIGRVSGGGMTITGDNYGGGVDYPANSFMMREPYALPGDIAGNIEAARPNGVAQVPYVFQAGDATKKMKLCTHFKNANGQVVVYGQEYGPIAAS